jgi:heme ABC exporter ATP-binding subunit CcmA
MPCSEDGLPPAVRCRGLVRRFGERLALAGVDLDVAAGETVLLTGPNGAGKTTLLRVLATVLRPAAGTVEVLGHRLPSGARAARALIGYAGHDPLVYGGLTARENLELYAALYGLPEGEAMPALERVGLVQRAGDLAGELSRGMLQRLSLARATLHRPPLLLLDEPTSALDEEARGVLDRVLEQPGVTTVIATHDPGGFERLAARRVRIDAGRVV